MRTAVSTSVLFTDLVGSTALSSRLGAGAAEELRRTHFGLLRGAVAEHGGREVKNLGDGLMVAFPGVGAALDSAVAMQQAIDRHNRTGGEPLAIRVGVAAGDAEQDDGDLFGEPVVAAARLCAAAEGGVILVPEVVRLLAPRGAHEFRPVGELELKGLPEPVAAAELVWAPAEDAPGGVVVVLPARLAVPRASGFVGRVAERERLEAAAKTAADGACRGVLVAGEAGMGKTRLVTEVATDAHAAGAVVLYGRCDEELAIPYQPWVEALGHYVAHVDGEALARHDPTRLVELTRLVPELYRRMPGLGLPVATDPFTERHLLIGAVVSLLGEIAREQLCVVVLDDLHWADRPTAQLLRQVLATGDLGALLVIGTFRDTDLDAEHPMADALAAFHRDEVVEVLSLYGLGDLEVIALLESVAGHDLADDGVALARAVRAETDGNPFFVGEVLRHLVETGAVVQEDGRWVAAAELADAGLPASVRAVVGQRVRRLGEAVHQVLVTAAVMGREFDLDTVAVAGRLDEDVVLDALEAATAGGLVAEAPGRADRFTFTHALVQHTLYEELSRARRVRLHHRVAKALEASLGEDPGGRIGELANHWLAATRPTDLHKAIDYAQRAGDRAMAALAPDEAVRWYTKALGALDQQPSPDPRRRFGLLVGLGDAQHRSGIAAFRETLLEAARLAQVIDDGELLVRAALTNTIGPRGSIGIIDSERVEVIDLALQRLGDQRPADRARLLAQRCMEVTFGSPLDERLALAEEAVATARASRDPAALLDTLNRACSAIRAPMTLDRRITWSAEACRLADDLPDPNARYHAYEQGFSPALERGDLDGLRARFAVMEEISAQLPDTGLRWSTAFYRVIPPLLAGDLDDAEQLAAVALELRLASGQPDAMVHYGSQLINIRVWQGRLGELVPLIDQAAADNPGLPVFQAVLALACVAAGEDDRARRMFHDARDLGFPVPEDATWSTMHYGWSELAVHFADRRAAETLLDRIAPFGDHVITTSVTVTPVLGHSAGKLEHLLGRYDEAEVSFRRALAIHERLESPPLIAMTQTAWAAMLTERARPEDVAQARALATAALDFARRNGYGTVERDARAVLGALGTR